MLKIPFSGTEKTARGRLTRPAAAAVLAAALSTGLVAGCTSSSVPDVKPYQKSIIWPQPPEPARISYLKSIERPQDIGANQGFFNKLADLLLGAKDEQIAKPYGVAVDSNGRVIVVDTALKRVHIFDMRGRQYFAIERAENAPMESPIAAAIGENDDIYVTDSVLGKVFVFNNKGKFISSFEAGERPTGIAINRPARSVYVADTGAHKINVFGLDGARKTSLGKWGNGPGEFNRPVDICLDRNGDLYVADTMNFRVQIFDSAGKFINKFGHHGDGTGDFGRPKGIAVDNEGNIYVADGLFDTIQIFNRSGAFLLNFGSIGREPGTFWLPAGIFIDNDKIFIADSFNKRVQVFEYLGS